MANERTCCRCGKVEDESERFLFIADFADNDLRKLTCRKCHEEKAKEGTARCPNTPWHHVGSTCPICKLKD